MSEEREKNVYFAKLAEQAERYDEMADYMKVVAESGSELTVEVSLPCVAALRGSSVLPSGAQPVVCCLQECGWFSTCFLAHHLFG